MSNLNLSDFECLELSFLNAKKNVYKAGSGPAVIIMHEAPGIYPAFVSFARKVRDEGFTVYMPQLLGKPVNDMGIGFTFENMAKACISNEFTVWATKEKSPITDWLRELAKFAGKECNSKVGAIGMCLTGGFALAMMVEDCVEAPVLSQPSLPLGVFPSQRRDLGIDDATLNRVKERTRQGACLMGLRFTNDVLSPGDRFQRLKDELKENFIAIEIDSSTGNKHDIPITAHSVLAYHYNDTPGHPTREAYEKVIQFFKDRLK